VRELGDRLLERMNRGGSGTLIVPSHYLEAVVTKP
jgi:hypothetical protein